MWSLVGFMSPGVQDDDGSKMRTTLDPVRDGEPPVMNSASDWNESFADKYPLNGIARRTVGGAVTDTVRGVPVGIDNVAAQGLRENDARYSNNGLYAAREAAGVGGHGTIRVVDSLEPTIRDGAALGGTIALADRASFMDQTNSMTPVTGMSEETVAQQQAAVYNAFAAVNAGLTGVW